MKFVNKGKISHCLLVLTAIFGIGFLAPAALAQPPQMDPNQIVEMISSTIGVTDEQKPEFSKTMLAFFEQAMPIGQEMMSGGGDAGKAMEKMQALAADLEEKLKAILTEEQMQAYQDMQRNMGPPPQ